MRAGLSETKHALPAALASQYAADRRRARTRVPCSPLVLHISANQLLLVSAAPNYPKNSVLSDPPSDL